MTATKTLNDIKDDMAIQYSELRSGEIDVKISAELTNIAGKWLKADQLQYMREALTLHIGRMVPLSIGHE